MVSVILVVKRDEPGHVYPVQRPIYYINEVLHETKQRYPHIQKLLYPILITKRKVLHYFQDHKIVVVTEHALGDILRNKDATGRIAKWAIELSPFELGFQCRDAIKSQALVDFLVEWTDVTLPVSDTIEE